MVTTIPNTPTGTLMAAGDTVAAEEHENSRPGCQGQQSKHAEAQVINGPVILANLRIHSGRGCAITVGTINTHRDLPRPIARTSLYRAPVGKPDTAPDLWI
jgi:hypothetical protein